MYSAIKRQGQPLYKLARQGIEVDRPLRKVTIFRLELDAVNLPFIDITVRCSSGTYVRSLAHDLGERLGCGGHITMLRRTAVGHLGLAEAVPLAELTSENLLENLLPLQTAVQHLPALQLVFAEADRLRLGQPIDRRPGDPASPLVSAGVNGQFAGILRFKAGQWWPHKIFPADMDG